MRPYDNSAFMSLRDEGQNNAVEGIHIFVAYGQFSRIPHARKVYSGNIGIPANSSPILWSGIDTTR